MPDSLPDTTGKLPAEAIGRVGRFALTTAEGGESIWNSNWCTPVEGSIAIMVSLDSWAERLSLATFFRHKPHLSLMNWFLALNALLFCISTAAPAQSFQGMTEETEVIRWNLEGDQTGILPSRIYYGTVEFDGKIWVIGGNTTEGSGVAQRDVWYSTNGREFTAATTSAAFGRKTWHGALTYDGKMWVIGGNSGSQISNDVWYSTNGALWTLATGSAAFSPRGHLSVTIHNDRMYLAGGVSTLTGDGRLNDVWSSVDGVNWTQHTAAAEWAPRLRPTLFSLNGKLWMLGGAIGSGGESDVWMSPDDGATWQLVLESAPYGGARMPSVVKFSDRIWLNAVNSFWWTLDGSIWNEVDSVGDVSSVRSSPAATLVFQNELWSVCRSGTIEGNPIETWRLTLETVPGPPSGVEGWLILE